MVLHSRIYYRRATRIPRTFNRIKALSHFAKTNEKEKKKGERGKKEEINRRGVSPRLSPLITKLKEQRELLVPHE